MRKAVHFFPVLMPALILAGCASMSADNCGVADWGAAGFEDGARGEPFSAIGGRASACPAYAAFDVDAYLAGVSAGLSHYCEPANAFAAGAALLYAALAAVVLSWAWQGVWFDAYDALLWLVAFTMIEVNVLERARAMPLLRGIHANARPNSAMKSERSA